MLREEGIQDLLGAGGGSVEACLEVVRVAVGDKVAQVQNLGVDLLVNTVNTLNPKPSPQLNPFVQPILSFLLDKLG
jgi:hypothetical protein